MQSGTNNMINSPPYPTSILDELAIRWQMSKIANTTSTVIIATSFLFFTGLTSDEP